MNSDKNHCPGATLTLTRGGNGVGKFPPPNFGKSRLGGSRGEKKKEGEEKREKEKRGKGRKKKRKENKEGKGRKRKIVN